MSAFMEKNADEGPGGGLPTAGAHFDDSTPTTPTVQKSSAAPTAGTGGQGHQGWRARRRARHHERRMHHEAAQVEKGLPEIFHKKDLEGQERLERASKLLRVKNELIAALSEFVGTFLFLFLAFGIANSASQQALISNTQSGTSTAGGLDPSALLLSATGFGFSLAVNAWLWFRVSGGLFNPAVTLALFLTGTLTITRSIILMCTQFLGALAAAGLAQVLIPGGISVRTKLGASTTVAQGFFVEFFMTIQLIMAVYMLAGEKHKGTFLAPVGIGLALFIAELFATSITGGSLNPARTLAPDVIAAQFDGSTWIYYVAPFTAALASAGLYKFLLWANFSTVVPDQDDDGVQLLLRDAQGNATGYVERTNAANNPEIEEMRAAEIERRLSSETIDRGGPAVTAAAPIHTTQDAFANVGVKV